MRPQLPQDDSTSNAEYVELMTSCWHVDPAIRPTFLESMTRLSSMSGGTLATTTSHSSSTTYSNHSLKRTESYNSNTSGGIYESTSHSTTTSSSGSAKNGFEPAVNTVRPPEGEVVIVFTDITRAASLWEFNAEAMRDATLMHNKAAREIIKKHGGYEVIFLRDRNSGEGSFCVAFSEVGAALDWCADMQRQLLKINWPPELLEHPGAAEEWGNKDDRVLFKGLRVRMGVHIGNPKVVRDPMTRRVEYIGPAVNVTARITALAHGGQVVISEAAFVKLQNEGKKPSASSEKTTDDDDDDDLEVVDDKKLQPLGKFEMPDNPKGTKETHVLSRPCALPHIIFRIETVRIQDSRPGGTLLWRSGDDGNFRRPQRHIHAKLEGRIDRRGHRRWDGLQGGSVPRISQPLPMDHRLL